jgi:ribosomal protein S12 methylthiotransferase
VGFDTLLTRLSDMAGDTWIRFLYGHPESITEGVIQAIADHDNLCPYFDLPIQHAASRVLKKMGRNYDQQRLMDLFARIREVIPKVAIRTTLIVGFPGETEADFQELMDFVQQVRFDHLGVFPYSDAEDLPSHRLPGKVPPEVAQLRHDALMERQMDISAANLSAMIGKTLPVLIEDSAEPRLYEGRSMLQAPEVDGLTFVKTTPNAAGAWPLIMVGQTTMVKITETMAYDLIGEAI